ncbi:LysR family transcriptional regulator [Streptomyces sp. NPDC050534]|uniref:LysR family transcriptional regulator n=1 Tax=Streptomyces sp. NPDC050534 TaxID=3365625 RepID=UPI003790A0A4
MNVEVRHLRALVAIGEEGTITDAALALRISQPALSRTLEQLERRLGVRLVERTTRRLALTESGQRLWEQARRILAQLDDALAEAAARAESRPLHLAFAWAALGRHTVPLLRTWRERHPDTPVQVRRLDDPEAAVRRGVADLAVLRTRPAGESGLAHTVLAHERRMVAVPEGHPLAGRDSVRLGEMTGELVALCSTAATSGVELWPEGRAPRTIEVPGVDEWLTVIATGEAVGVTAEGTVHHHPHPGVRYLPLTDADFVTVHLAWPAVPTHPATEAFLHLARQHATAGEGRGPSGSLPAS